MRRLRARGRRPPPADPGWAYFLDLDGTLVDIVEAPDAIRIDDGLRTLVARLHAAAGGALAVVSGRALDDLERRLGDVRLTLVGQHGLERRGSDGQRQVADASPAARSIRQRLEPLLERHPGLLLEDKGLSLALHYRRVPQLGPYVHRLMRSLVAAAHAGLALQAGKCVIEIRPGGHDKGKAIEALMQEAPFRGRRPVSVGDDLTDEHGFAVVNRLGGLSIKVGRGPSRAGWRLEDAAAVRAWLATALD